MTATEEVVDTTDATLSAAELYDRLESVVDDLATCTTESLGAKQLAAVTFQHERIARKLTGLGYQRIADVEERATFTVAGFSTLGTFLASGLRLGRGEANRRLTAARSLARYHGVTGELLEPKHPRTAAAVASGAISAHHVSVIADVLAKLPSTVDPDMRSAAETELAQSARSFTPTELGKLGDRILAHLDPDGKLTDDKDRRRQRGLSVSPQDRQLMTKLTGQLTPAVRAQFEVILDNWAAPGMNTPADEVPLFGPADTADADALAEARSRDTRTQGQRNHDAFAAVCTYVLGHGGLGPPARLPAELVITTSVSELAALSGFATTATGTDVPISDLVELAAQAQPWLAVFRNHTSEVLHLGRGRRLASKAQRLALFARDRGCTGPRCDTPFSRTQAHHAPDWAAGGPTDLDHLGAACGRHNRTVGNRPGQWETTILTKGPYAGRMGWRPAGSTGDWQVNSAHHPDPHGYLPVKPAPARAPAQQPGSWRRHHRPGTSIVETLLAHCAPGPIDWSEIQFRTVRLSTRVTAAGPTESITS